MINTQNTGLKALISSLLGCGFSRSTLNAFASLALLCALVVGALPGSVPQVYAQDAPTPPPAEVNINKADAALIASTLKGVGDSRAKEIVRYREQFGPFASVDELADVKGIGQSTLEANRARITLE